MFSTVPMWLNRSGYLYQTMKKNIIGLLLIVLCPCIAFGQQRAFEEIIERPLWILKFAPLSLIDINPTYQIGAEYFFTENYSLQQEVGYGHEKSIMVNWNKQTDERTWRFRTEFRKYLPQKQANFRGQRNYIAYEIMFKRFDYPADYTVTINKGNYFENTHYTYQFVRDTYAFHVKLGQQEIRTSNFVVDGYLGLGIRWNKVYSDNANPNYTDTVLRIDDLAPIKAGFNQTFSVSLGFKIGFVAKAKTK